MKATVEWIPCATRLPDDDERVLVVHEGDVYVGWYDSVRDDGGWISDDGCPLEYEVTHWATFPEVPGDACAAEPAEDARDALRYRTLKRLADLDDAIAFAHVTSDLMTEEWDDYLDRAADQPGERHGPR